MHGDAWVTLSLDDDVGERGFYWSYLHGFEVTYNSIARLVDLKDNPRASQCVAGGFFFWCAEFGCNGNFFSDIVGYKDTQLGDPPHASLVSMNFCGRTFTLELDNKLDNRQADCRRFMTSHGMQ